MRLTAEQEKEIRRANDIAGNTIIPGYQTEVINELLAEIDALREERNEFETYWTDESNRFDKLLAETVKLSVYESVVLGRSEFRMALSEERLRTKELEAERDNLRAALEKIAAFQCGGPVIQQAQGKE